MSTHAKKITIESNEDFSKLPEDGFYHIQVHFKRPIKRARGSIEFDKPKNHLTGNVLGNVLSCKEFSCEDREIHPTNISRISICRTNFLKDDVFKGQVIVAPRSEKFDYLYEYAGDEKAGDIIEFKRRRCFGAFEWLKIYYLLLIVPIGTTITTGVIMKLLLDDKVDYKDLITVSVTVGGALLGLQALLRKS